MHHPCTSASITPCTFCTPHLREHGDGRAGSRTVYGTAGSALRLARVVTDSRPAELNLSPQYNYVALDYSYHVVFHHECPWLLMNWGPPRITTNICCVCGSVRKERWDSFGCRSFPPFSITTPVEKTTAVIPSSAPNHRCLCYPTHI